MITLKVFHLRVEIITVENSQNESNCFIDIYTYELKSEEEYDLNSGEEIFLMDKESQKFIFDETVKYTKFLYPNVEINNNLDVKIKNQNNTSFTLTIFFNNQKWKSYNESKINSDINIIIKKDDWKDICNENTAACGVSFGVSFESSGNGTFEIIVSSVPGKDENRTDDNKNLTWFFIIGSILALVIIVIVLRCIYKNKMSKNVEDTTFPEDKLLVNI